MIHSILRLFGCIVVPDTRAVHNYDFVTTKHMVSRGYVLAASVEATKNVLEACDEVIGLSSAQMNATLQASWSQVLNKEDLQLFVDQLLHYMTGYVPNSTPEPPSLEWNSKTIRIIEGITRDEAIHRIRKLANAGIALKGNTIDDIVIMVKTLRCVEDVVAVSKNKELNARLYEACNVVPSDPEEYLRYLVYRATGETMLIKNSYLIGLIVSSNEDIDKLLELAPADLGSIFYRYKPLFLALKKLSTNKTFFNKLARKAKYLHKPYQNDPLLMITADLGNEDNYRSILRCHDLSRLAKVADALSNRLIARSGAGMIYRVRNGRTWIDDDFIVSKVDAAQSKALLAVTKGKMAQLLADRFRGKKIYIPEHIQYAFPRSEKLFVGNVPEGTRIILPRSFVIGVHWYNMRPGEYKGYESRVDVDFSLIMSGRGKIGWDAAWRTAYTSDGNEPSYLFSGDLVDAPRPLGATESFFVSNVAPHESPIMFVNHFNRGDETAGVECRLLIGESDGVQIHKNYTIDPNKLLFETPFMLDKAEISIGRIRRLGEDTHCIELINASMSSGVVSSGNEKCDALTDYMNNRQPVLLKTVLESAGAIFVNNVDEAEIDMSPSKVAKSQFTAILR